MGRLEEVPLRGSSVRPCPGVCEGAVCCNLHVMEPVEGCPLSCSYCFLQAYRPEPKIRAQRDPQVMLRTLERTLAQQPGRLFRVGTGELGDSIALDRRLGFAAVAVPAVARMKNVVLELKTKAADIDHLLDLQHGGRTVVAWSLNTERIAREEERGCASIGERLEAAARLQQRGYLLAFHFDPIIDYEGCEADYEDVIETLGERIDPARVAWISLGTLRLDRSLPALIMARHPHSRVATGELVPGFDGKLRYPKHRRVELLSTVHRALRAALGSEPFTYICMDKAEVWRRTLGWVPEDNPALDYAFACNLVRRFPYLMGEPPRIEAYRARPLVRDDWRATELDGEPAAAVCGSS